MVTVLGPFIRFIHLLFIAIFLGLQIASYYYVITSQRSNSLVLQRYTLNLMLFMDWVLLVIIAGIYLTCAYLVYHISTLSYATPWIHTACVSLTLVVLCFCTNMFIQYKNLKRINYQMKLGDKVRFIRPTTKIQRRYNKLMHANYIIIIILLLLTIHDAVTRSTF